MGCVVDELQFLENRFKRWEGGGHLCCDSHEELMQAAQLLRLKPQWLQKAGRPDEHFDLTPRKRSTALAMGIARQVSTREMGEFILGKRRQQQQAAVRS